MKNKPFLVGTFLFLLTLAVDAAMVMTGLVAMGIFSFLGTVLVFSTVVVWLIYKDDKKLHFRGLWRVIPLMIFGIGVWKVMEQSGFALEETTESLTEVGNLLMSRYQVGLWVVSTVIFFSFVISSSLMTRKRA